MADKDSLRRRIARWWRPEPETYETRKGRPPGDDARHTLREPGPERHGTYNAGL